MRNVVGITISFLANRASSTVPSFVPTPRIEALLRFASAVANNARKSLKTRNNA